MVYIYGIIFEIECLGIQKSCTRTLTPLEVWTSSTIWSRYQIKLAYNSDICRHNDNQFLKLPLVFSNSGKSEYSSKYIVCLSVLGWPGH